MATLNTVTELPQQDISTSRFFRDDDRDSTLLKGKMAKPDHAFQLIKGVYSPAESENMLQEMISSRIKYHNLEAFIILEQYNGDTGPSKARIEELKATQESLKDFLKEAREKGWQLEIKSGVEIKVI